MFEQLINLDQQLLLAINGVHAPWADDLMWYISVPWVWIPLYLFMFYCLWRNYGWKGAIVSLVLIIVSAGLADYISSGIIKPLVCRLRPTHEPSIMGQILLVRGCRGGLYGFVSSHAANTMAVATGFFLILKNNLSQTKAIIWAIGLGLWVVLNCYSRMYLGVHYPGDIIGGLVVGWAVAFGLNRLMHLVFGH